jgi:UDP-N-acetylglucosamine enolpyruvyl transferase
LSKKKVTPSKGTPTKSVSAKGGNLIRTRGMGLSIKLFKHSGVDLTSSQIATMLKASPYSPKNPNSIEAGFSNVTSTAKSVTADFAAGFRVPILTMGKDGALTPVHYVSVDRGAALIKLDRGTIEVRGSERIARKFRSMFEEMTGAKITPLNLNGGTMKLYNSATDIASVLLTGVEKGNITQAEFRGQGIQREEDIGMYTRRYKGQITRFRGTYPYPSGALLTTTVNAEVGSLMVYKGGEGILEKDLDWIVELMENAALEQGQQN